MPSDRDADHRYVCNRHQQRLGSQSTGQALPPDTERCRAVVVDFILGIPRTVSAASIDFVVNLLVLNSHWVLVVMDPFTRRIIGFGVHAGDVDGIALCRMFNRAISNQGAAHYLSSDNDPLFRYQRWKANLRILEIDEIKSIPIYAAIASSR